MQPSQSAKKDTTGFGFTYDWLISGMGFVQLITKRINQSELINQSINQSINRLFNMTTILDKTC